MVSDEQYQLCLPVLADDKLDDDDKTEKLEEILSKHTGLKGPALENAVLDALWRHRNATKGEAVEAPLRHTIIRKSSPAPWQVNRAPTPLGSPPLSSSPARSSGFPASRPSFSRQKSNIPSPFASPKPSPRLSLAQPIPHSPSLNAYEFSDASPAPDIYGDYGSENVEWLLQDETGSNASSTNLSAAAPEWQPQPDMSPYDILRSVLGDKKTDDEIEDALNQNSYDLGATIASLLGTEEPPPQDNNILVGKSMAVRPTTPVKNPIVCKYWLASGSCLRADCRFAHDTSGYLCKYWMAGQCLAGDACQFSHDPSLLINHLSVNNIPAPKFEGQDSLEQFPNLASLPKTTLSPAANGFVPSAQRGRPFIPSTSRPHSRPTSRQQQHSRPETPSTLSMDDETFPTLASAKRATKQHHGHRSRHNHTTTLEKEIPPAQPLQPSSLADVVRMSPSAIPTPTGPRAAIRPTTSDSVRKIRPYGNSDTTAARRIPEPQHIPWLETGAKANQQYLKFRAEAIKHGSIRNKFLQSAAQAWNRNDARAAKALSLRGQAENEAMRKAHREAADALFSVRNSHFNNNGSTVVGNQDTNSSTSGGGSETYIDLHGLHPEEAIDYLSNILSQLSNPMSGNAVTRTIDEGKIVYAITGTGHHSKNGKDKVGKGVRGWLNEAGYLYREFSVPGERGGYIGGVLGVDVGSGSWRTGSTQGNGAGGGEVGPGVIGSGAGAGNASQPMQSTTSTKVQLLKREDVVNA